jgi:CheY-like chemotaxis protein
VAEQSILIVDDDDIYAYALSRFLKSCGYTTTIADGSMAAFRALEIQKFDLVVTDLRLHTGEPHGASLGRMIRNKYRDMPVVLVTAHPDLAEIEKPLPGPIFDKVTPLHKLAHAVATALARSVGG